MYICDLKSRTCAYVHYSYLLLKEPERHTNYELLFTVSQQLIKLYLLPSEHLRQSATGSNVFAAMATAIGTGITQREYQQRA